MLRLFSHSVSGWLVGLLVSGGLYFVMDYQLANEQAAAAQCETTAARLQTDVATLEADIEKQNTAITRLKDEADRQTATASADALRVLRDFDARKRDVATRGPTNGPEELNQWLNDLFFAPSPYAARDAPPK